MLNSKMKNRLFLIGVICMLGLTACSESNKEQITAESEIESTYDATEKIETEEDVTTLNEVESVAEIETEEKDNQINVDKYAIAEGSYIDQFLNNDYLAEPFENYTELEIEFCENDAIYTGTLQGMIDEFCDRNNCGTPEIFYTIGLYSTGEQFLVVSFLEDMCSKEIFMIQKEDGLYIVFESTSMGFSYYDDGVVVKSAGCGLPAIIEYSYYISPSGKIQQFAKYEASWIYETENTAELVKYDYMLPDIEYRYLNVNEQEYGYIYDPYSEAINYQALEEQFCAEVQLMKEDEKNKIIDSYAQTLGCNYLNAIENKRELKLFK